MISLIMPFYKKFEEFKFSFEQKNFVMFNKIKNMELIICVDDPHDSEQLKAYLSEVVQKCKVYFSIKVFFNNVSHEWRCPSKAINVGIKHASYEKIIVISPETIVLSQSILSLSSRCHEQAFSFGIIKHVSENKIETMNADMLFLKSESRIFPYGSICFTKSQAHSIGGYDESFVEWGGDDDDFRERLLKAGYSKSASFAKFLHVTMKLNGHNRSADKTRLSSNEFLTRKLQLIKDNQNFIANEGRYGNAFATVLFNYTFAETEATNLCEP